jgi:hypothetical protein
MQSRFGRAAPRWLIDAEVCNGWYSEWTAEVIDTRLQRLPLIIGVPHSREWIEKAHSRGVKVLPYVTFYKALDVSAARRAGWRDDHEFLDSPLWAELDLGKHPEWTLYGESGDVRRPFDEPDYPAGWQQACTNAPGYAEAALRGVHALMNLGADGLFVDNVDPTIECFGPAFHQHRHAEPEKNNKEAFAEVLAQVYDAVKSYGEDKIVVQNPGLWEVQDRAYPQCADAVMIESYICTWAAPERWTTWDQILSVARQNREAVRQGKVILALSYLGHTPFAIEDDAFYCYACAKLSGFHWADWFTVPPQNKAQTLFTVRLGAPTGETEEKNGVFLRAFANGLVAVNPSEAPRVLDLPDANKAQLLDLYAGRMVEARAGAIPLEVPGQSGRVYVRAPSR